MKTLFILAIWMTTTIVFAGDVTLTFGSDDDGSEFVVRGDVDAPLTGVSRFLATSDGARIVYRTAATIAEHSSDGTVAGYLYFKSEDKKGAQRLTFVLVHGEDGREALCAKLSDDNIILWPRPDNRE